MFVKHSHRSKFDLLVLGEDEYYFSDESVIFHPPNDPQRQIKGRMKVCSMSLFFDPHDEHLPISRYEFRFVSSIDEDWGTNMLRKSNANQFVIKTKRIVNMRANNAMEPYNIIDGNIVHKFTLNYVSLSEFLAQVDRLFKINKLAPYIAIEKVRDIIEEKENKTSFDTSWLEYLDEKPLKELHCVRVTPLVNNPGRLMITNKIVYFQPMNNVDANPVEKFPFSKILRVIKRRHSLLHVGLEIFLEEDKSVFFAFRSESIRTSVFNLLTSQPGMTKLQHENQSQVTFKWQCGLISNFEYLMYLNSLADRTFNDLTQYPVFPWLIADNKSSTLDLTKPSTFRDLSKPIGALNPERLKNLKQRYQQMEPPKFLYGSHYSTPGYVLYYLVRVAPEYMLKLHNGTFDKADRLFTSVPVCWDSVYNNQADFKELIPEFFISPPSFLVNSSDLRLGRKQDGTWVGDVELPPWAKDPETFVNKNREALESEYVSSHLHEWIDLIFGYKQQGNEAAESNNLFHPYTYEGALDLEKVSDPVERNALRVQINEFGQTPKQIFSKPHPKRFPPEERERKIASAANIDLSEMTSLSDSRSSNKEEIFEKTTNLGKTSSIRESTKQTQSSWSQISQLKIKNTSKLHRKKVSAVKLSKDTKNIISVSDDSYLKIYDLENLRQLRSMKISELALSSCCMGTDDQNVYIGSWDNNVYVYSVDYSRIVETLHSHDDAVSSLALDKDTLVTGSWDSTVRIWKIKSSGIDKAPISDIVDHESAVKCVELGKDGNIVVSGAADGKLCYNDLRSGSLVRHLEAHSEEITSLKLTDDGRLITTGADNNLKIFDAMGQEIFQIDLGETLRCISSNGEHMLIGGDDGTLRAWNLLTTEEIKKFAKMDPLTCVDASRDGKVAVTGDKSGTVALWTIE